MEVCTAWKKDPDTDSGLDFCQKMGLKKGQKLIAYTMISLDLRPLIP